MRNPIRDSGLMVVRSISLTLNFLSIPIFLELAGSSVLGSYYFLYSIFCLISILDLGIGNALIGIVTKESGSDKRIVLLNGIATLAAITFTLGTILQLVVYKEAEQLFNLSRFAEIDTFSQAFSFVLIFGLLNNFGLLGIKYQSAVGNYKFTVYFETFSVVLSLVSTFCLLLFKASLISLILGLIGVPTLLSISHLFLLFRGFKFQQNFTQTGMRISQNCKFFISKGRLFLVLQISTVVSMQIDPIIIGKYLGPTEVASIAITWKIFSIPYLLFASASGGLWAEASTKSQNDDNVILGELLKRNIQYALGYSTVFGILILCFGKHVVRIFSTNLPVPDTSMIVISSLLLISLCVSRPISLILNGYHKERFLIFTSTIAMFCNYFTSVFFVQLLDRGYGALLGSLLAQSICVIIPTLIIFRPRNNRT